MKPAPLRSLFWRPSRKGGLGGRKKGNLIRLFFFFFSLSFPPLGQKRRRSLARLSGQESKDSPKLGKTLSRRKLFKKRDIE